jgi:hypothetical protein
MNRILIAGLPRSGTTWLEQTIRTAGGTTTVGEPDNEDNFPFAIKAKRNLGRYPVVRSDAAAPADYSRLWDGAFSGGRQPLSAGGLASTLMHHVAKRHTSVYSAAQWSPWRRKLLEASARWSRPGARTRADTVVVKSVFVALALPWVCDRWQPRLVVMTRSSLNTIASWRRLDWARPFDGHPVLGGADVADVLGELTGGLDLPPPPPVSDVLGRLTWELSALMTMLSDEVRRRPGAIVVRHEDLCLDPTAGFRSIFADLGLEWTERTDAHLAERNRPGATTYDITRVASEEPTRWRKTLSSADVDRIAAVTSSFGLAW